MGLAVSRKAIPSRNFLIPLKKEARYSIDAIGTRRLRGSRAWGVGWNVNR
jgi:hypothetical protein